MVAITRNELKKYDGTNGKPVYIAYMGKVYNLSPVDEWEMGEHFGHLAGRDLTEELEDAPHDEEVFEGKEIVGELVD
jgi:predicted heme/steroid binding protein